VVTLQLRLRSWKLQQRARKQLAILDNYLSLGWIALRFSVLSKQLRTALQPGINRESEALVQPTRMARGVNETEVSSEEDRED
jgi:hypothetical protein